MVLDIETSLRSPIVRVTLGALAAGLLYTLARELRKIPAKLMVLMATAFLDMVALLVSAPVWGRFSDRFGRRPALLVALGASAIAYVIFGFANSLAMLFISRLIQGAGGGTVGVIQAYVADSVEPDQRARGLGWLSAARNLGVALGPVLGSFSITLGNKVCNLGGGDVAGLHAVGHAMPGW